MCLFALFVYMYMFEFIVQSLFLTQFKQLIVSFAVTFRPKRKKINSLLSSLENDPQHLAHNDMTTATKFHELLRVGRLPL